MGKKVKTGKFRKDKFYQLAKESGYRSRAAFKLLQLNRSYHFLEKSRICVDLCAAPGGWLQVAATHMPMSSVIIGVDLASIKPIANVVTHMEDITSEKCRQLIKKDLSDNKADVFLHDGAPNVGKNWLHDAYQQNMLVLQAFKLATEFLKKGGWFITKVFRSKDYYSIMWVFQQFFKKVESTKPQASRNESAEIFVVCQNYKAPDKIDPKFFDIKFVFSEVESQAETNRAVDLFKSTLQKRNRGGYPDGDMTLYHVLKASEFVSSENFIDLLSKHNKIELDDEKIANHVETTEEIKESIKDLKLLGKTDLKNLLKWRLKLKADLEEKSALQDDKKAAADDDVTKGNADKTEETEESLIEDQIKEAIYNEKKTDKKKRKREEKEKKKLKAKLALNMVYKDDILDHKTQGDNEIFSLDKIKTKKQLIELQDAVPGLELSDNEEENDELKVNLNRKRKALFSKFDFHNDDEFEKNSDDENDEPELGSSSDDDNDEANGKRGGDDYYSDEEENPLLDDLSGQVNGSKAKTNLWFNKDSFDFLKNTNDQNNDLLECVDLNGEREESDFSDSDDSEAEKNGVDKRKKKKKDRKEKGGDSNNLGEEKIEAGDDEPGVAKKMNGSKFDDPKKRKLSAVEMAIGETMVNSKKAKRDLIDSTYNRYSTFENDSELPKWFVEDEEKNYRRDVVVPRQVLNDYRKKFEDINARPIKKVVEAQARKKRRMSKKLDKARKKAENISDNVDMTDKERSREIKQVYKKAGLLAKKKVDVKYVIAKRGVRGKVAAKGIKGPYKVVDRRLKKDRSRAKAPGEAKKRTPRGKKGTGSFQRGRGSKKVDQKKNKRR